MDLAAAQGGLYTIAGLTIGAGSVEVDEFESTA